MKIRKTGTVIFSSFLLICSSNLNAYSWQNAGWDTCKICFFITFYQAVKTMVIDPFFWPSGPVKQKLPDKTLRNIDKNNDSLVVQKRKRELNNACAACEDRQDTFDLINDVSFLIQRMQLLLRKEQNNPGSLTVDQIEEIELCGQKLFALRSWEKGEAQHAIEDLRAAWIAQRRLNEIMNREAKDSKDKKF